MRIRPVAAALGLALVIIAAFLLLRYRDEPVGDGPARDREGGTAGREESAGDPGPQAEVGDRAGGSGEPSIAIEVRDQRGVPVPGSRVGVWPDGEDEFSHWDALARATAGPDGQADLPVPRGSPSLVFTIHPPRDRPDLVRLVLRDWRPGDAVPPLPPALSVSGTVVGTDDRPIPGANVHCSSEGYDGSGAICDAEGRFRIGGLGGGPVTLVALPETFGMTPAAGEAAVVRAGDEGVRLVLRPDTELTIRLYPWRSEWPVSAYLFTEQLPGGRGIRQITFRDGVARARGLRPHLRYSLRLTRPYFGLCPLAGGISGDAVSAGVELAPGLAISGTLEFPGKPVHLELHATHRHPFAGNFRSEAEIREDGTFRITGLYPTTFSVLARAAYADESECFAAAEVEAGGTVDLRLVDGEEFDRRGAEKRRLEEERQRDEER